MKRVMGIETEYGISVGGNISVELLSRRVVDSFRDALQNLGPEWDGRHETPMADLRGHINEGDHEGDHLTGNMLTNAGRYYVDLAHPEYTTPICDDPYEVLVYDKAGERIVDACRRKVEAQMRLEGMGISIIKNNSDKHGNSYGCHENMLLSRRIPVPEITRIFVPFFASRQVLVGAGKFGYEVSGNTFGLYQISQRAEFFEAIIGGQTTHSRPIINTRDEPHADKDKYMRLHIIVGDANMSEWCTYLKIGIFALVAELVERGVFDGLTAPDLLNPVRAMHNFSLDTRLKYSAELKGPSRMTALDIQEWYLSLAEKHLTDLEGVYAHVLRSWREVVDALKNDSRDPTWSRRIDWLIKLNLLAKYSDRKLGKALTRLHSKADYEKLVALDLLYHEIDPEAGWYYRLAANGKVDTLIDDEQQIADAVTNAPTSNRSYFIGECIKKFEVTHASWDSIEFRVAYVHCKSCGATSTDVALAACVLCGATNVQRHIRYFPVNANDPFRGSKELVGSLIENSPNTWEFLKAISAVPLELKPDP